MKETADSINFQQEATRCLILISEYDGSPDVMISSGVRLRFRCSRMCERIPTTKIQAYQFCVVADSAGH